MKLLLDMNISPGWVDFLTTNGVEAIHWLACGAPNATDSEISMPEKTGSLSLHMTWISAHYLPAARTASQASFSFELTI